MSHPFPNRGESFNFAFYNEPNYHQIPQFQISTAEKLLPEWDPFSRPKSVHGVRNQAPSPIASVHSTRTAPNPRLSDFMAYYPSNPSPTNNDGSIGIQNGSSMLDPNYLSGAFNPSLQADSWNTFNLRSNEENRVRSASCQSDIGLLPYPPPGSGIDKRGLPSDEGYHSLKSSHSVRSNEPDFAGQDFPMNTLSQVGHMTVDNGLSGGTGMSRMPSDQISRVSSTRSRKSTSKPLKCVYDGCDEISKSNSEYRKHLLKHEKPHKCYVHNCRRDGKGFATINDLDRHKKSVHGIDIDKKSWKCAAERCKSREKWWPRLDNFKQHVRRMHKDEDELDFIKRSTWDPEKQIFDTTDEPTVAPMDTNFALAGLGKSFASGSPVCSMPSYDVLSERGNQRWPSSEQDQHTREKALQSLQFLNVPSPMPRNTVSLGQSRGQRRAPGLSKQTQSSLPTDVERDIAPEESISQAPQAKPDHGLSNAPQTKAEQQRSALQKLSQAVSTQSNPVNLERIILDILHKATDSAKWDGKSKRKGRQGSDGQSDSNAVTLTKSDALAASQMISNLIKQSPGSAQAAPRQASKGFILNPKICTHEGCKYKSARDCDMRKHMKRHARPYGCTFPKCHKRFGAKSDWKRHENSQHFQLEAFRCAHEMPSGKVCGVHLHRQQAFENHLESHGFSSKNWGEVVRRSKIGKNRQGSFWCGFCNLVTELKTRRNAAWDERFDHIARHFEKDKKSIEDWVCAEENKTKKELLREMDRYVYDDDDDGDERERDEDLDASGEEDDEVQLPPPPPPPPVSGTSTLTSCYPPPPAAAAAQPEAVFQISGEKRPAPMDSGGCEREHRRKRQKTEINTYCCGCSNGPMSSMQVSCVVCEHQFCRNCRTEQYTVF